MPPLCFVSGGSRKSSTRSTPVDSGSTRGSRHEKRGSRDSGSPQDKKDPALLRNPGSPTITTAGNGSLKSDQSILEQIGEPDHQGWMRKRGERYNTWKSRYFVLKGPHLYWLKSGNASVRIAQNGGEIYGILNMPDLIGDKDQRIHQHHWLSYCHR